MFHNLLMIGDLNERPLIMIVHYILPTQKLTTAYNILVIFNKNYKIVACNLEIFYFAGSNVRVWK